MKDRKATVSLSTREPGPRPPQFWPGPIFLLAVRVSLVEKKLLVGIGQLYAVLAEEILQLTLISRLEHELRPHTVISLPVNPAPANHLRG